MRCLLLVAIGLCGVLVSSAQGQEIPSTSEFFFGRLIAENDTTQLLYAVSIPVTEEVEQTYTVEVPYSETVVTNDGRETVVTKTRTETRTRVVPVTRQVTEMRTALLAPNRFQFTTMAGQVVAYEDLSRFDAAPVVVFSNVEATIPPFHRSVFKPETLVLLRRPTPPQPAR